MTVEESSANPDNIEYVPLEVTAGILVHIGAGIYHSVAGALKELVANSYDADATQVVISTDYPRFDQFKIVDTGTGMTATRFKQAMRSIGSSLKGIIDPERKTREFNRPVIGQLGIGVMALSQICSNATIESQVEGAATKFVAKLDFSDFKRRRHEEIKLDVFHKRMKKWGSAGQMKKRLKDSNIGIDEKIEIREILEVLANAGDKFKAPKEEEREHLGYCLLYPDLPAVPGGRGTTITLENIESTVKDSLLDVGRSPDELRKHFRNESLTWDSYRDEINEWKWHELCERLRLGTNNLTFQWLPKYHQFLWELGLMTPTQYIDDGPVTVATEILEEKKKDLSSFNFSLLVDNRRLLKPLLLPSGDLGKLSLEIGYDYYLKPFSLDKEVDGEQLKYSGYIFWQRSQIQPSTIRGVQIYIRNVGIGLFDDTLLNFSTVNTTSRAGQMSGEIYIEKGLERALNVDRNSFRETDAHYVALQQHLWNMLGTTTKGDGIIGASVDAYWARKGRSNEELQLQHERELGLFVKSISKGKISLTFSLATTDKPYSIAKEKITVYENSPKWPRALRERHIAQKMIVSTRVALETGAQAEEVVELLEVFLLRG